MQTEQFWQRAIIHVDMNAFFASIEQLDQPQLRNKPVAVTNGECGSCIITCSYEARHYGIKTGMRFKEALRLCPRLIRRPANPARYAAISRAIMADLINISPDIEIFSVDEAFLDVTACQKLWGTPEQIGKLVKQQVWQTANLPCSVGIAANKAMAKFAANLNKPDGCTTLHPQQAKQVLAPIRVTELCGIGPGIARFLAAYGVLTCGDMEKLPIGILAKRFGNLGRRIWYMCQGIDFAPLQQEVAAAKSMGHGKVIPPGTTDSKALYTYLSHMSHKLTVRLRRHDLQAQTFFIGLRNRQLGWLGGKAKLAAPSHDFKRLIKLCRNTLRLYWSGQPIDQVQITALDPQPTDLQADLFQQPETTHPVTDLINQRFGHHTLVPGRLIKKLATPDVIAPAWKPSGHRQSLSINTIADLTTAKPKHERRSN